MRNRLTRRRGRRSPHPAKQYAAPSCGLQTTLPNISRLKAPRNRKRVQLEREVVNRRGQSSGKASSEGPHLLSREDEGPFCRAVRTVPPGSSTSLRSQAITTAPPLRQGVAISILTSSPLTAGRVAAVAVSAVLSAPPYASAPGPFGTALLSCARVGQLASLLNREESKMAKQTNPTPDGDPGGIRTRVLHLERVACWASAPQGHSGNGGAGTQIVTILADLAAVSISRRRC